MYFLCISYGSTLSELTEFTMTNGSEIVQDDFAQRVFVSPQDTVSNLSSVPFSPPAPEEYVIAH